ncbi:MAG: 2-oxo acid dehydrogenase subunit E2 [Bacteroidetes bacterium]|nr:2-oxo acid dehydrogenase subunit E2 [Bacteroidota bacterium]
MAYPVIMPRQGQSVETCIITEWYLKKGDEVSEGDLLFAYETDKASFEEVAEADGILLEIFFNAGDEVPVLTNIAVIGEKGEDVEEFKPVNNQSDTKKNEEDKSGSTIETKKHTEDMLSVSPVAETGKIKISPRARKSALRIGLDYKNLAGTGPGDRIIERDIENAAASMPRITPLARTMMEKRNLTYDKEKAGSKPRITTGDLLAQKDTYVTDFKDEPLSNVRKLIANAVFKSLSNSAQLTHHTSADARKILELRKDIKCRVETTGYQNVTINDIVCYAVINALKKHPEANAHFLEDKIRYFKKVNLGFAVDAPRGLMVPVVVEADKLSMVELSVEMEKIAGRCHSGNVDPGLLSNELATFTVSNLGAYGVEMFTPVINLPQVGILGVNTIIKRPAELEGGVMGFVPYIGLSLTYDHRAIDGGPASLFLKTIKEEVEGLENNMI